MAIAARLSRYPLFGLFLLASVLLAGCNQEDPPAPTPVVVQDIRLGFVFSATGPGSTDGAAQQIAAQMAVDDLNSTGRGPFVVPVFKATDGTGAQAVSAFRELIDADKVEVIIGPTLSSEARSAHPVAQAASVPVVAVSNPVGGITDVGDYIFRVSLPHAAVIPTTVAVAKDKLKVSQVCLLYAQDDAFSRAEADVFRVELDKKSIKVLGEMTFSANDTDFTPQLRAIKSLEPDAIVVSALAGPAQRILQQARKVSGIANTVHIIGGYGFTPPQVVADPTSAEGLVIGVIWSPISHDELSKKFVQEYEKATGQPPGVVAAQTYTGVFIAYDAIKRANVTGKLLADARTAIRDNLRSTSNLATVLGPFSFTDKRDAKHAPVVMLFHNGQFEPLSEGR